MTITLSSRGLEEDSGGILEVVRKEKGRKSTGHPPLFVVTCPVC